VRKAQIARRGQAGAERGNDLPRARNTRQARAARRRDERNVEPQSIAPERRLETLWCGVDETRL